MPVYLVALGTATPSYRYVQAHIESFMADYGTLSPAGRRLLRTVYAQCGVEYRHSVLPDFGRERSRLFDRASTPIALTPRMEIYREEAPLLGAEAARRAFAEAPDITPADVTHLITFSCTGMSAPGLDIALIPALGLPTGTARTCINFMGCYAGITALRTAAEIACGNPSAKVLLVGVELCTLHFLPGESRDQLVANALFADGAAAALVSGSDPGKYRFVLEAFRSELAWDGGEHMAWELREAAFEIRLSGYVPALLEGGLQQLVRALDPGQQGFSGYAIHPGGKSILEAAGVALKLPDTQLAASYQTLAAHGNMSSVTIFFVLQNLVRQDPFGSQQRVLACAFGPGLTLESAVLRFS